MAKIQFTTVSGSTYVIEGDTLTRLPSDSETNPLRRDGEKIPVFQFGVLEIGQPATFLLNLRGDGIATNRTTNIVTEIKDIS